MSDIKKYNMKKSFNYKRCFNAHAIFKAKDRGNISAENSIPPVSKTVSAFFSQI
jgi:hypothetical protein